MHSKNAKIVDLAEKHLQTKEKIKIGGGGYVGEGSKKEKEKMEGKSSLFLSDLFCER
jgi:hypothetical protein